MDSRNPLKSSDNIYVQGTITIKSGLPIEQLAQKITELLEIPPLTFDTSGMYEEQDIYLSQCLGFEIGFCHPNDAPSKEYELSIMNNRHYEIPDPAGPDIYIDATDYMLLLLKRDKELDASATPEEKLFD
jgi:hypothetical protein